MHFLKSGKQSPNAEDGEIDLSLAPSPAKHDFDEDEVVTFQMDTRKTKPSLAPRYKQNKEVPQMD